MNIVRTASDLRGRKAELPRNKTREKREKVAIGNWSTLEEEKVESLYP